MVHVLRSLLRAVTRRRRRPPAGAHSVSGPDGPVLRPDSSDYLLALEMRRSRWR